MNGIYNSQNPAMFNNSQYGNSQYSGGGNNNVQFAPSTTNQQNSANNSQYVGPSVNYNAQSSQANSNSQGVNGASAAGANNITTAPAFGSTPTRKYANNGNNTGSYYGPNPYYSYGNSPNPNYNSGYDIGSFSSGYGGNVNYGTFPMGTNLNSIYGTNKSNYAGASSSVANAPIPGVGPSAALGSQGAPNGQAQSGAITNQNVGTGTAGH
jgi:hypothetical protein